MITDDCLLAGGVDGVDEVDEVELGCPPATRRGRTSGVDDEDVEDAEPD